jgi:glycosyltransferase involved in cell wall biosynthesis
MAARKILIYYPPNGRSIAIETLCKTLQESGNEVFVLTLTKKGLFHQELEKYEISAFAHYLERRNSLRYFIAHARYLVKFCKQHEIDEVWSHLQEGNIIAVLAQPFLKPRLVTFRHHAESAFYAEYGKKMGLRRSKKEAFLDKVINRLAKLIVVPSSGVWYGMQKYEGCNMKKVRLIPYIYDFSAYQQPDIAKTEQLRKQYDCRLLLIMVSRMIVNKQHMPVFEVVNKLVKEGMSVKMLVMDDGPLREELQNFIVQHSLGNNIFLVGFRQDFVNYMAVSDMLIHPSVTEASNNVVKEMGLLRKAVAVCRNVGDFNDYIEEGRNGYFLDNDDLTGSIERVIRNAYTNPGNTREKMGQALRDDVMTAFSNTPENKLRFLQLFDEHSKAVS